MACKHNGGTYSETTEITVGPEIVTYEDIKCSDCGKTLRRDITGRRPK